MIWNFTNSIQQGNIIVANGGRKKVLGIGIVTGEYIAPLDHDNPHFDKEYTHLRKVDWKITDELELNEENFFLRDTITKIDEFKWEKIKDAYIKSYPQTMKYF